MFDMDFYRWNVFTVRSEFANFKPNQNIMFGQNRGRWRRRKWSELGTAYGLTNRDAWWQHTPWRWSCLELKFCVFVQRMMLVVAENLEHYWLGLQVLNE